MASQVSGIIEQIQPSGSDGTKYAIASTAYGYCQTAANQKAKTVDMTGFKLIKGVTIHVKFQYNNTAANPTLNVNGTGALNIVQYGTTAVGTTDETNSWYDGAVVSFTYDGTSWVRDQGFNTNSQSAYGNITTSGKIGTTADLAIYTTTDGLVTAGSLQTSDPSPSGTATAFITSVSQDSKGQISASKANLPTASTSIAGITKVGASGGAAAYDHNHDTVYSAIHQTTWSWASDGTQPLSKYVTFDANIAAGNAANAPEATWYNGFVSSHGNYLGSFILNKHRTSNWYVGWEQYPKDSSTNYTAPTWYLLAHSGNISTGDNNGQVKIAGQNIAVKGLAALAYKDSLLASDIPDLSWNKITSDKPNTLSGYGITDAASSNHSHTLKIGNKSLSVNTSEQTWALHDILYSSTSIGTATSWDQTTPGVYYVASNAAFTGTNNPENANTNNGITPYRYGQLIVSRANAGGMAEFYISHDDSNNASYGIHYRTGWNNTYVAKWSVLLDSYNYNNWTVTKTGTGASGDWGINITGTAAKATADASGNTITSTYATKTEVNGLLAAANAMTFKGTLGTGGTVTALPATHNAGDTYRVITAGTWAGKYCEVGTLIICTTNGTAANDAHWTSVETNEDGAVIGATPTTSTDNAIVRWDGTSGRIIQNSGITIDDNNIITSNGTDINFKAYKENEREHGIFFRSGFFSDSNNKYNLSILTYDHSNNGVTPDGLSINAQDGISFCTGSNMRNEQMRINSSGNVGIGTTSPSTKLHVNGTVKFNLPNNATYNKEFIITGPSNNQLSIANQGMQAYDSSSNASLLFLQYYGGALQIGNTDTASAERYLYGKFDFKSADGFKYSGIGTGTTDISRPIWFMAASNASTIAKGLPVYNDNFKYNPSTNTLTIGTGTISATSYSGNAANVTGTVAIANGGTGATTALAAGLQYSWTATIQGQTWSRLCYIPTSTSVVGSSVLLNIRATRTSVVYNYTLLINSHHSQKCWINVLQGSEYTSIKFRGTVDSTGNLYLEIQDSAQSIANTTTQSVICQMWIITKGATEPTLYTTFTSGETLASGFIAKEITLSAKGGFQTNSQFTGSGAGLTDVPTTSLSNIVSTTAKKFLKDTGAWVQVDWEDLTNKPDSFTPSSHTHYELATIGDNRNDNTTPNTYKNRLIFQGLKYNNKIDSPYTDTYSYLVGLRGWADSSGGNAHELAFSSDGIHMRWGATTTWGNWLRILNSGNTYTANSNGNAVTVTCGSDATLATINDVAIKINVTKPTYTYSDVGAAPSSTISCTTANVQSALSINTSSGSATKALTEKGTFVTFGTSNLTIGTSATTAMAGNTVVNKVKTTAKSDNVNYKILMCAGGASLTSGNDYEVAYDTGITLNPSTNTLEGINIIKNNDGDSNSIKILANEIVIQNSSGSTGQAGNKPYITSLHIGNQRNVTLDEYKNDHLAIRGSSILLNTATPFVVYDSSKTYNVGDIVWYSSTYYICKTAITTAESWTSGHWTTMPSTGVMVNSNLNPWKSESYSLGTSTYKWANVYATTFNGNATSASTAAKWTSAQTVYVALGTSSTSTTLQGGSTSPVTLGVNGTLGIGNGGTGKTSWTKWGILYASDSTTLSQVTAGSSSNEGQVLISGGAAAPIWNGGLVLSGTGTSTWTAAFKGTTDATDSSTAAVTIAGGLAVAKKFYSNNEFYIGNSSVGQIFSGADSTLSGSPTTITNSNLSTYFTVNSTDATYPWNYDTTNSCWANMGTTQGIHNINNIIMAEWKVLSNFALIVEATVNAEHNYDYFEILVNDSSKFTTKGGSGTGIYNVNGAVYLKTNDIVKFRFKKDSSNEGNPEYFRAILKRQSYSSTAAIQVTKNLLPTSTNSQSLGSSNYRWQKVYIGTTDSYGDATTPIYWDNGVPTLCTPYANATVNYATSADSAKWLMNRGTNVTITDSSWVHGQTGAGGTNTSGGTVWKQKWTQSGLTYTTTSNGTTTSNTLTDSGDMIIWLSQNTNSNNLWANMAIDGYIYSLSGFKGGGFSLNGLSSISLAHNTANSAIMSIQNTSTGTSGNFYWGYSHLMPSLAAGGNLSGLSVGTGASDNNSAYFGWHSEGSNNDENYLSMGIYAHNHLIKVYKTGNTVITGTLSVGQTTRSTTYKLNVNGTIGGTALYLQDSASDPSLVSGARIEFSYTTSQQPVVLSYTPNDAYRAPAGLKVLGGSSATPAWFEVEGTIYAPTHAYRASNTDKAYTTYNTTDDSIDFVFI